jgi:hypothetical protein
MTDMADMTPEEENAFYTDPDSQLPRGHRCAAAPSSARQCLCACLRTSCTRCVTGPRPRTVRSRTASVERLSTSSLGTVTDHRPVGDPRLATGGCAVGRQREMAASPIGFTCGDSDRRSGVRIFGRARSCCGAAEGPVGVKVRRL